MHTQKTISPKDYNQEALNKKNWIKGHIWMWV